MNSQEGCIPVRYITHLHFLNWALAILECLNKYVAMCMCTCMRIFGQSLTDLGVRSGVCGGLACLTGGSRPLLAHSPPQQDTARKQEENEQESSWVEIKFISQCCRLNLGKINFNALPIKAICVVRNKNTHSKTMPWSTSSFSGLGAPSAVSHSF